MKRFPWTAAALALAAGWALAAPAEAQSRNPLDALRLEELAVTRERPLFRPTRRPVEAAPIAAPAPQPPVLETHVAAAEPPPYELIGIAIGGGTKIALLRNKASGEVLRLRPGEEAEGWRVAEIGRRQLTLQRDGRSEALALTSTAGAQTAGETPRPQSPEAVAAANAAHLSRVPLDNR